MRWLRWGLTLEAGGFSVLLVALVVGLVAVLLFVPACPVMLVLSLFAMLCIFPPALGRVLCLAAPRESGLHAWLITGLAASALAWSSEWLFPLAALLDVQFLVVLARWLDDRELTERGRRLQRQMGAWFVAVLLLQVVESVWMPLFVWGCWLFASYVILVLDVRAQLVSSR